MSKEIMICPKCYSKDIRKYDIYRYGDIPKPRYKCRTCGHLTIYSLIKTVATRRRKR